MLSELHIRVNYGIFVLAVKPSGNADSIVSPDGTTALHPGDILVVMGSGKGYCEYFASVRGKKE